MAPAKGESFDEVVLPHLDAAYRLARWLMRNVHDAEDAVQEALLRAFRYFRTYTGGNGRAWLLRIVRNTCFGWRSSQSSRAPSDPFDEERHSHARAASDPEVLALRAEDVRLIEQAMRSLPARSRELLVLRELEGLSYQELAAALGIPMGTVMSSLSRARQAFRIAMDSQLNQTAADLDRIPNPIDAMRKTYGDEGARTITDAGNGAIRSREVWLLRYRPDLSRPTIAPPTN